MIREWHCYECLSAVLAPCKLTVEDVDGRYPLEDAPDRCPFILDGACKWVEKTIVDDDAPDAEDEKGGCVDFPSTDVFVTESGDIVIRGRDSEGDLESSISLSAGFLKEHACRAIRLHFSDNTVLRVWNDKIFWRISVIKPGRATVRGWRAGTISPRSDTVSLISHSEAAPHLEYWEVV